MRKWDRENPEKKKEFARKWRANNIESCRKRGREWAKKDRLRYPEKYSCKDRKHYMDNRESERKRSKEWHFANRDRILVRMKEWRTSNLEKRRIYRNKYNRRYRSTAKYRFENALRQRIWRAVTRQTKGRSKKCSRTVLLIGCSIPDLKIYLESKFEVGMDWTNFGNVWHVDHIMPCAIFDLSKPEHQKRCFHFSNLRPCFALENIRKGKKVLSDQYPLI